MEKSFYMVWRDMGGNPVKRHETIESAREEARRLAQENPCIEFFVLRKGGHIGKAPGDQDRFARNRRDRMEKTKVRFIKWLIRLLLPTHYLSRKPPKGRKQKDRFHPCDVALLGGDPSL